MYVYDPLPRILSKSSELLLRLESKIGVFLGHARKVFIYAHTKLQNVADRNKSYIHFDIATLSKYD